MLALASFFGFNWGPSAPAVEAAKSRRKRRTIIPVTLKPGGLSRFGYSVDNTVRSRHAALLRAAREEGFAPIIQRLNVTATFLKNSSPKKSRVFKMDQRWLSDYYDAVKEREGRKTRRGSSSKLTAGASSPSRARLSAPVYDADNDDSYEEDEEYDMSLSQTGPSDDDTDTTTDTDTDSEDEQD